MKKFLSLSVLILLCELVCAQCIFTYNKSKEIQLKSDSSTIVFANYVKTPEGTRERIVNSNGTTYRFIIRKVNEKKVQEILDDQGNKRATVLLSAKDTYDVLLSDGVQLSWSGISNRKWSFSHNGKTVTSGALLTANGKKQLAIASHDASYPTEVLELIALERGTDKIISSSKSPALFVISAMVVMAQALASN